MRYCTVFIITNNGMQSEISHTLEAADIHEARLKVAKYVKRLSKIVTFEQIYYSEPKAIEDKKNV